ncbi:hypothetical protein ACH4ZX_03560 [Streptomyces sp. NPDC020490]|uniref:hypothetical protein n=1 Tax=Streptomyces sp. NPDC020490 TaxID=3365078 RepID=UPI0037B1701F
MNLTSGARVLAGATGLVMLGGLAISIHGILRHDVAHSVGGTCLTLTAFTTLALVLVHKWIVDTREDRRLLAAAQREAQAQRSTYQAAKAALESEQGRLTRDAAAERAKLAVQLKAEREALHREFEERRAELISQTMEATVRMFHNGRFAPGESATGNLIPFPQQQPEGKPERERSREHGGVRP